MSGTPLNGNTQDFVAHVHLVAHKAAATLPELSGRIQRALDLIFAGAIEPLADDAAMVRSQTNPEHRYKVTKESCECLDFPEAPEGRCKHRVSWMIYRRALANLIAARQGTAQPPPAPPGHVQANPQLPASAPRGPEWVEATVCLKARRHDGREVSWTFRGSETQAVAWFETRSAYLDARFSSRAEPGTQTRRRRETAEAPPAEGEEEEYCAIHDCEMSWHEGNRYGPGWYSHRLADGTFCKGQVPRTERLGRRRGRRR